MKKIFLRQNSIYYTYMIVGILSAIIFCTIYGVKILNPTYTDWLFYEGKDLPQHYLGWVAYRNSAWHFPLGMTDTLSYPHQSSVIFTDSIPLMAVFFKLLSPILPKEFQYFGLWGLLCFILQGILAARIVKGYAKNNISVILISVIFLYAPIMLRRMYVHTALAGHWIILLGLEPVFAHEKYRSNKRIYFIVALMGILSALTHVYLVLMSGIVLVGICLTDIIIFRRYKRCILLLGEYLCMAAFVIWILGGFTGRGQVAAGGLGLYSLNLNAFVNPMGWSSIFNTLPTMYNGEQGEGFAWIGAGFIFLLPLSVILFLGCDRAKQIIKEHKGEFIILFIVAIIAVMVALSPTITLGDKELLNIRLPIFIYNLWALFRCTGRIAWISVYIMMLCVCIVLSRILNKRTFIILMAFGLFLQMYDSHEYIETTSRRCNSARVYDSMLKSEDFWNWVAENNEIEHVVYCSSTEREGYIYHLAHWALKNNKTMNTFHFAHASGAMEISTSTMESLNNPSCSELFIFAEDHKFRCVDYKLHYYSIDGLIVGYVNEIDGFEEVTEIIANEYRERREGIEAFMDRLYQEIFGVAMDDRNKEEWCGNVLRREWELEGVVHNIIFSLDDSCSDEAFVRIMYRALLGREADDAGLSGWVENLNQGMDREQLFQSFIGSDEFFGLMEQYRLREFLIR